MDGHFVPNMSFGHPVVACMRDAIPDVYFDVHLMVEHPLRVREFPENTRRNLPLWYLFEPGSTLKIFLVAAALEERP